MPRKIHFWVVQVTGEDEDYPASELNVHGPSVKGWQSTRFCQYPQEIVIQLEARSRISKTQVLSHQYLIATKIEIFVGDVPAGMLKAPNNVVWQKLGDVLLQEIAQIDYKARELVSVVADVVGSFVRLVVHRNYVNRLNLCNQVGIIALNVIGDKTWEDALASEEESASGVIRKEVSLDDLAFEMRVDQEVALLIRKLEEKKLAAVADEKFEFAQKIKESVVSLQKVGEKLGELEMEKQWAIDAENYDKARARKEQMDEFRMQSYLRLELTELLDINKGEKVACNKDVKLSAKKLPPIQKKTHPLSAKFHPPTRQSLIPGIQLENFSKGKREGFHSAPESTTSHASRNVASPTILDTQEMALPIAIFGLSAVENLWRKTFLNREIALQGIQMYLEHYDDREENDRVLFAAVAAVQRGLRDKVFSVFTTALELMNSVFTSFISQHRFSDERLLEATKVIASQLLQRVGDSNPRIKSAAIDGILELVETHEENRGRTVAYVITKSFPNNTNETEAEGRCEIILKLLQRFNAETTEWLSAADLMKFGLKALDHSSPVVKEAAERIILSLYIQVGDSVVGYLPAMDEDDTNFQHLWQEIERIDDRGMALGNRANGSLVFDNEDDDRSHADRVCIFCHQRSAGIAAEGLNTHYWRDCPVLMYCPQCKLVIEVSTLMEHLLGECSHRNRFRQCPTCLDAVAVKTYEKHVGTKSCRVPKPEYLANRCPLCHLDTPPWEDGLRRHLTDRPGCPLNPRGANYSSRPQASKFSFFRSK